MQFAYKILFGIVDRDYSTMFSLNAAQSTRGHNYKLYVQSRGARISVRGYFSADIRDLSRIRIVFLVMARIRIVGYGYNTDSC
jgi:hypothetical protein